MKKPISKKDLSAFDAKFEAQKIAFAPITFQCARTLRNTGILEAVSEAGADGIHVNDIAKQTGISKYGVKVLLDMGKSMSLVDGEDEVFHLLNTGHFVLKDRMSQVNMDFVHDTCYKGMFHLEEAIRDKKPAGLKELGDWATVYEGLAELPDHVRKSWFEFDHFYSDGSFPILLDIVFADKPKKLYDVGGNTGKWSILCAEHDPDVAVTILDLPGQLRDAMANAKAKGFEDRIKGFEINMLDDGQAFPTGANVIWMSQFLDCFSEEEILSILKRAATSMDSDARLYILETYWDRQRFDAASYSLNATSLYFTAIANGNSRMYHSKDMIKLVHEAGLVVERDVDDIGRGAHTLFRCKLNS